MGDQIDREFGALKQEYHMYLQRFGETYGMNSGVVPLTVRQFCAAAVLCDQAWHSRDLSTVSELQNLMLLG